MPWLTVLLLLLALSLRLGWVLTRPVDDAIIDQLPDQREYLETARNALAGEGLAFTDARFGDRVYAYRTPGYPLFIAALRGNVPSVRIAQAILDASSALAVYLLARRWLNSGRANLALTAVAVNPFLVYFCGLILTETLFTCLLAWGMFCITSRRTLLWLLGSVLLVLSIQVRPSALALPILLGIASALLNRPDTGPYHWRWPLPVGTTMLLLTLAVLAPWAYRNHRVLGEWVWTSTNGGITRYDGFSPDATGASDQAFVEAMPQLRTMGEIGRNIYLGELANQFIRDNPLQSLRLAGIKVARTWSPMPLSSEFARPTYVLVALAFTVPFDLLVIAAVFGATLPRSVKAFLLLPALYLTVSAAASVGSLRYRVPAEVPMAMLAAAGLPNLARGHRSPVLTSHERSV